MVQMTDSLNDAIILFTLSDSLSVQYWQQFIFKNLQKTGSNDLFIFNAIHLQKQKILCILFHDFQIYSLS